MRSRLKRTGSASAAKHCRRYETRRRIRSGQKIVILLISKVKRLYLEVLLSLVSSYWPNIITRLYMLGKLSNPAGLVFRFIY
jgi:hypothetical protein